jgi:hypothetical protein
VVGFWTACSSHMARTRREQAPHVPSSTAVGGRNARGGVWQVDWVCRGCGGVIELGTVFGPAAGPGRSALHVLF